MFGEEELTEALGTSPVLYTATTATNGYSEMSSKKHHYEGYVEYTGPFDTDWMEYQQLDLYTMFETETD